MNESGAKSKFGLDSTITETLSVTMLVIQRNCDRFYALHLHFVPEKVLPCHVSQTGLVNCLVTFFSDKISKTRDTFSNTDSFFLPTQPDQPEFDLFKSVSEDEVKIKSPTKSCLLDSWPSFLRSAFLS